MRDHKTRLRTGMAGQKRGQAFVQIWINQSINSTFANAHQVGERDRRIIQGQREGGAVKITSGNYIAGFSKDERIVGGRTGLDQENVFTMREDTANRAVDLRHATETVSVLDARVILAMRFANFAALQKRQ